MTISVDLTSEVEGESNRQAAARGRAVETYVASLLEEAACVGIATDGGGMRGSPTPTFCCGSRQT
jgi:hypothetical protein